MERNSHVIETLEVRRGTDRKGRKILNQYAVLQLLGEGSYGKVKLCTRGSSSFALKVINKALLSRKREYFKNPEGGMSVRTAFEDALSEIDIMRTLNHSNIVKLNEIIHDELSEKIYLVTDYCAKGQVLDWDVSSHLFRSTSLKSPANEREIRDIFKGIAKGLEYLHSHNIIHRDIKPQNIYLTNKLVPKIGDFGLAKQIEGEDSHYKTVGTFHFLPPECCSADVQNFRGKPADVWGLGLTLYAMAYLQLPFWAEGVAPLFEAIQNFQLEFPNARMSRDFEDLVRGMLEKNPQHRLTINDVLRHRWLK